MENATPMLRQYLQIKKEYPGTILFFRLGDFYEMFDEDALIASKALEITLTARQKDSPNPIPMCGVPHHAAAGYIAKLVRKGFRVAICEQAEAPGKGSKLVRREVVKVITPGTAIDPQLMDTSDPGYLASVVGSGETFACAFLELSTGEFLTSRFKGAEAWSKVIAEIEKFSPRELLYPRSLGILVREAFARTAVQPVVAQADAQEQPGIDRFSLTLLDDDRFDPDAAREALLRQLGVRDLKAFGLEGERDAVGASGACLQYAKETQKSAVDHVTEIRLMETSDNLVLDQVTLRNLEVSETRGEARGRSLFGVINETVTGMGARLLKSWLVRPSLKRSEIMGRLDAVEEMMDSMVRGSVRSLLKQVYDLERLVGRINLGTASARDLLALNGTLVATPEILRSLSGSKCLLLKFIAENIHSLPDVRSLIARSISDDPPLNIADGGTIRDGFNPELDELRTISRNAKQVIAAFEDDERTRSGISSLKIRFNNVFGYYIEISKSNLSRVPEGYERKQTLANAERFTTPLLKEWEQKVLGAEERIASLEMELFQKVRSEVRGETLRLQSTARSLAVLDVVGSLAEAAVRRGYVRPIIHESDEIRIKDGRHPIVEAFNRDGFVANDLLINNSTDRLLLITGPNMGGKSTILRQVALIQLMAQAGSFVPAGSASLPLVDRIWTRVGASDDLSSGRSTFMVEMTETAAILHSATPRSLVILDEIGRGTSTFDGLSIAWAVAEYLHNSHEHSAKTLFATHYHELTELAGHLPGAKTYRVTASEKDGEVVFLHKLEKGKANQSYGIAVAKLAGLPASVIHRSREILARLEKYELAVLQDQGAVAEADVPPMEAGARRRVAQVSLFAFNNESLIDEIRASDAEAMSDEELRELLVSIKRRII